MQKSFYPTAALIGLLFMAIGATTTYIALGQDTSSAPVTEAVEMTEEAVVSEVVAEQAAPVVEQVQPVQVIVPTLPLPTPVPPTPIPPTVVPPTEVIQPTVEAPAQVVELPAEVTEAAAPPVQVEILPSPTLEQAVSVEDAIPAEVTLEALPPTAENVVPVEATELVAAPPAAEMTAEVQPQAEITEAVAPVDNSGIVEATEVVLPSVVGGGEGMGAQNTGPTQPESVFTATPDVLVPVVEATEEVPVTDNTSTEPLPEATDAVLPSAESTEAVLSLTGAIFGQIQQRQGKPVSIQLLLTSSSGDVVDLLIGEQGEFQIDGLAAGDYTLVALAPGYLSRRTQFTLAEGETLELPLATLSAGDLNLDDRVDLNDIVLMAANYDGPAVMAEADLNGDEWVDISDLTIIGAQFGAEGPLPWV